MTVDISQISFSGGSFAVEPPATLGAVELFQNVMIGMGTRIEGGVIRSDIKTGRYCTIGRWVTIGAGEHSLSALSTGGPIGKKASEELPVVRVKSDPRYRVLIGHDVTIGDKATIMSGVTINTGAIIEPNTVVTKDVPAFAIVGGLPGRVVGKRFPKEVAERILSFRWWQFSQQAILAARQNNVTKFMDILSSQEEQRIHTREFHQIIHAEPQNERILLSRIEAGMKKLEARMAQHE